MEILVAEDDENDVLLLKRAFRRIGIQNPVQFCRDGQEVLDYLQGNGKYHDRKKFPFPTVVFLDIKMPRKSGLEVLKWLEQHEECDVVPTLILTSSRQNEDVKKAYKLGANAYFVKPVDFTELVKLLEIACEYWKRCEIPVTPTHCN